MSFIGVERMAMKGEVRVVGRSVGASSWRCRSVDMVARRQSTSHRIVPRASRRRTRAPPPPRNWASIRGCTARSPVPGTPPASPFVLGDVFDA